MQFNLSRAAFGTAGVLALFGSTILGSVPALAATITAADCQSQSGTYAVRAVAINQGDTITLYQTGDDGHFEGQGSVEVYCRKGRLNIGDINDAEVSIQVVPTSSALPPSIFTVTSLGGTPVVSGTNPLIVGPFTGSTDFMISAPNTLLPTGTVAADVGVQIEVVTEAWGKPMIDPITGTILHPTTSGDVLAQTPELDSLPLFATGALGLLSYVGLRRRARGK